MPNYRIFPIPLCETVIDKGAFMFLQMREYGKKITIPIYVWLIMGGKEPILIDSGCTAEDFARYTLFSEGHRNVAPIEEALPQAGVSLSEIKTIIITHLDADHILMPTIF